jgi:hypothetical protein
MGNDQILVSERLDSWPLFYINNFPKIINKGNSMVLYTDDTSIIITDTNKLNFETNLYQTLKI